MKADRKTESAVVAVLDRMSAAYAQRSADALLSIFADDADNVMIGTGVDEKRIGLGQIRAQAERDWAQTESTGLEWGWRSISQSASGAVAWVAADATFRLRAEGQEMAIPARITAVLEQRGDQWLIVQSHYSFASANQDEGNSVPR